MQTISRLSRACAKLKKAKEERRKPKHKTKPIPTCKWGHESIKFKKIDKVGHSSCTLCIAINRLYHGGNHDPATRYERTILTTKLRASTRKVNTEKSTNTNSQALYVPTNNILETNRKRKREHIDWLKLYGTKGKFTSQI